MIHGRHAGKMDDPRATKAELSLGQKKKKADVGE